MRQHCSGLGGNIPRRWLAGGAAAVMAFTLSTLPRATAQVSISTSTDRAVPAAREEVGSKASQASRVPGAYRIGAGDLLDIEVIDEPEFTRSYRVGSDGSISLPLLRNSIPAAGLTPSQLSQTIASDLVGAHLLNHPEVWVSVKESTAHSITISGAVQSPRVIPVLGQTTILDLVSQAGGLAPDAGDTATISRVGEVGAEVGSSAQLDAANQPPPPSAITVDLKRLIETGDPVLNVPVYAGDRVTVPHAGVFYVLGAVNKPGGYTLKGAQESVTVLMALAIAGDVTSTAKSTRSFIIRKSPDSPGGRQEVVLNLKDIRAGRARDVRIAPGDLLVVPENGGKKALRTAVSSTLGVGTAAATGLIIYRR